MPVVLRVPVVRVIMITRGQGRGSEGASGGGDKVCKTCHDSESLPSEVPGPSGSEAIDHMSRTWVKPGPLG